MPPYPDPNVDDEAEAAPPADEPRSGVLPTVDPGAPPAPALSAAHDEDDAEERPSLVEPPPSSAVPVARVSLTRLGVNPASPCRPVRLSVAAKPRSFGAAAELYLTVSIPGGPVVFEGVLGADGALELSLEIPEGAGELYVLVEGGTKYRHATVALRDDDHVSCELR